MGNYGGWLDILGADPESMIELRNQYAVIRRELEKAAGSREMSFAAGSAKTEYSGNAFQGIFGSMEDLVRQVQTILDKTEVSTDNELYRFYEDQRRHALGVSRFLPVLSRSFAFLLHQDNDSFQALMNQKVNFGTVVRFGSKSTYREPVEDVELDGVQAIILYNLINNARKYGIKSQMHIAQEEKGISVRNESLNPLPADPFALGERGKAGESQIEGSGCGLFISKLYADLAGYSLSGRSEPQPGTGQHAISFSLGRGTAR